MFIRASSLEGSRWYLSFGSVLWLEVRHLYLIALKKIVVASGQALLLLGCELELWKFWGGFPMRTYRMRDTYHPCDFWRLLLLKNWVYFGLIKCCDYYKLLQAISKYIFSLCCPLRPHSLALPGSLMFPLSGTLIWTAVLQLNNQVPAFGISSKYCST